MKQKEYTKQRERGLDRHNFLTVRSFNAKEVSESGFTLLEMLFVVGILAMFYGLILTNFGQSRAPQQLRNAQNELISNLEKIRSYSLSGRRLAGLSAKMYVLKIDRLANSRQYLIQGVAFDDTANADRLFFGASDPVLERIPLPQNISVKTLKLYKQDPTAPSSYITVYPDCVQVGFAVPFGKTHITECSNAPGAAPMEIMYDDPSALSLTGNATLTITLQRSDSTTDERLVVVRGVSGRINAN